ncbi:hypothetical protein QAD02_009169 [Eretmocerus hayati]|uniref:Uncharacterized protein n=1 Tax=Eretmocerus hayati TaxID=131215 RepID=A0ACC2N8X1_9HYME|nr:hypothetical protein QAD02_009169 [Eretmocerus hayati]
MTDTAAAPAPAAAPAAASPKKAAKKAAGAKKPAKPRAHPPAGDMVLAAIKGLADKKGSSLQAIKKYIAAHYKCDVEKQSIFIRKFLKSAVAKKTITQTKGSGAAGSFKLAPKAEGVKKVAKKPAAKKAAGAKKPAAAKKPKAAKKPSAAKKAASPKKPKAIARQSVDLQLVHDEDMGKSRPALDSDEFGLVPEALVEGSPQLVDLKLSI